ncbi:MAG: S8 family serine peptidase [Pseudomonadota bacterium]
MTDLRHWLALALVFASGCVANGPTTFGDPVPEGAEAVVIVLDDTRPDRRKRSASIPGYLGYNDYANDPALLRVANRLAKKHDVTVLTQWPLQSLPIQCIVIEKPDASTLAAIRAEPGVKWVQPFVDFTTMSVAAPTPSWPKPAGFAVGTDAGNGITIALVDTSVDRSHPALRGTALRQQNFAGNLGDIDGEAHGTAMVGLIAARPLPDSDMVGISQAANIELLRGCWQPLDAASGRCNTLTLALALDAAVALQPDVLNLSITGPKDRVLDELIDQLTRQGTLVVAAYDERRAASMRFPTHQPGVIYAFGVSDAAAAPAGSTEVVVGAPRHALSLAPAARYDLVYGHSVAAAQVSGFAALLFGQSEGSSRDQVVKHLHNLTDSP